MKGNGSEFEKPEWKISAKCRLGLTTFVLLEIHLVKGFDYWTALNLFVPFSLERKKNISVYSYNSFLGVRSQRKARLRLFYWAHSEPVHWTAATIHLKLSLCCHAFFIERKGEYTGRCVPVHWTVAILTLSHMVVIIRLWT